ncbi:serine/arginine repetitive matrix protein 1-like [Pseudonaja textilis]|uniref:serine/arginine repetitive matrix protein 1-like n=1 Tax=Pseudonaja textilis TaxID=8673 RepID=UPI000EAABD98|nr:serine/arginine repetitive matrix protein 1-like [Pseudonaja textilis]
MGDTSLLCHPPPEGCCLELHEALAVLLALIVVVQLALRLATVVCYYFCCLVRNLCGGQAPTKEPEKPLVLVRPVKKVSLRKPSLQFSNDDPPPRRRQRSRSPPRRCLQCTLEPLKVTMNLENGHLRCRCREHRHHRHSCPDYLPCCCSPRYYNCECDNRPRPRPRTSSAPSAYPSPRFRDVAVGTSDLLTNVPTEDRRNTLVSTEPYGRTAAAEAQRRSIASGQEAEYLPPGQHSQRPARVYIYPVHPQTPPGSRSPTPERAHRRRTLSQDEQAEFMAREQRRGREPEPPTPATQQLQVSAGSPPRFHNIVNTLMQAGAPPTEGRAAGAKPRLSRAETPPDTDWVYRTK